MVGEGGLDGIGVPVGRILNKSGRISNTVALKLSSFLSHQYGISIKVMPIINQFEEIILTYLFLYKEYFYFDLEVYFHLKSLFYDTLQRLYSVVVPILGINIYYSYT